MKLGKSSMSKLRIFHKLSPVHVLGPGIRAVIWVQGCPFQCPGCLVPESWSEDGGYEESSESLAQWVMEQKGIDGLTLSGGEPMLQAKALANLVDIVRDNADMGVICYTGYNIEHIIHNGNQDQHALLSKLDMLIDGAYIREKHADLLWRGSSNQRLIALTDRYKHIINETAGDSDQSAGLEFFLDESGHTSFAGVPSMPGFRTQFEGMMRERGIDLKNQ